MAEEKVFVDMDGGDLVAVYANKQRKNQASMLKSDPKVEAFMNPPEPTDDERLARKMTSDPFIKQLIKYLAIKEGRTPAQIRQSIRNA